MKILFLSAFSQEMAHFKKVLDGTYQQQHMGALRFEQLAYQSFELYFSTTGMGTVFAGIVTSILSHALKPDLIVFAGTAGGIGKQLSIGDIVVADSAVDMDMYGSHHNLQDTPFAHALVHPHKKITVPMIYPAGNALTWAQQSKLSQKISIHFGCVASSNYFPAPTFIFDTIKSLSVLAIDMESAAIYQTSWLLSIDALVIRAISNLLDDDGHDADVKTAKIDICAENIAHTLLQLLDVIAHFTQGSKQYAISDSQ